ncbi:MAG: HEPN domain-containing protein [Candidatus Hydrogenedentes bacterium]|nr:HEPN domain-containing protein [Candidatus Hydrogenedentota bacterium]
MIDYAKDCWLRALASIEAASHLVDIDPDSAASRAYYAAFHAICACFALQNISFTKHAQLRAAVHRDLVKTGKWDGELGRAFDFLADIRDIGDYGGKYHVSKADANSAISRARSILEAVRNQEKDTLGS